MHASKESCLPFDLTFDRGQSGTPRIIISRPSQPLSFHDRNLSSRDSRFCAQQSAYTYQVETHAKMPSSKRMHLSDAAFSAARGNRGGMFLSSAALGGIYV